MSVKMGTKNKQFPSMDDKYTLNSHQPLSCVGICSRACARQNKQVPTTKAASQKEDGQVKPRRPRKSQKNCREKQIKLKLEAETRKRTEEYVPRAYAEINHTVPKITRNSSFFKTQP